MYLKFGYSGKDLQRAIVKHGLFDERLKQKQQDQSKQHQELLKIFDKYKQKKEEEKTPGNDEKAEKK